MIKILKKTIILLVLGFRQILGPRGCCKFIVPCSEYAVNQIETRPLHKAIWAILKRLLSCHPFSKKNQYEM